jgi:Domain of Unknown Function (DUF1080)
MHTIISSRNALRALVLLAIFGCRPDQPSWKPLFNGRDLAGWDTYLGPRVKTGGSPGDTIPLGLNKDPNHVFSVVSEEGVPAIRISGENHGGISTLQEFRNYHFVCEFKWGQNKIPSFKDRKRDSGILYHAVGPHGADAGFWMRSQEFQIQEGDCGDYWGVAGGVFDIPAVKNPQGLYVYDPNGPVTAFSALSPIGRRCIKNPDAEKPTGQWNTVELYCKGDTSVHVINGVVNMILYHSRQSDNGHETPLKQGKIQIQSEGCEIFYRNIKIESIDKIPSSVLAIKN